MPIEQVTVPKAGESITEATLNRWLKPDGASVKADEPLFELGTDKATQEVAAPVAGVVKHLVKEGETVAIGAVVAQIDTDAEGRRPHLHTRRKQRPKHRAANAAPLRRGDPLPRRGAGTRGSRGEGRRRDGHRPRRPHHEGGRGRGVRGERPA